MEKIRATLQAVPAWFNALSQRERRLVSLAGGASGVFFLFILFISFATSAASYERRTRDKLMKLQEIQALASSFRDAEQARQAIERQLAQNNARLISLVEERGNSAGLDIQSMNPKGDVPIGDGKILESAVELTLSDVPLRKLHDFLLKLEAGPGIVKVKYLRLEPKAGTESLTAWLTIATYKLK